MEFNQIVCNQVLFRFQSQHTSADELKEYIELNNSEFELQFV